MGKKCEIRDCREAAPVICLNGHYLCTKHFEGAMAYLGFRNRDMIETLINRLSKFNKEKPNRG